MSLFTNDTHITIPFGYDYIVTIAGVNGAGEGNRSISMIGINAANLVLKERLNVDVKISRNGSTWKIDAIVDHDNELVCYNSDFKLTYIFCPTNATDSCFSTSDISQTNISNKKTALSANVRLNEDEHYNFAVSRMIGKTAVSSNPNTTISTFDVHSIENRNSSNGSICVDINYINGSVATGCHIKLTCDQGFLDDFDIDGYNKFFHKFWCSPDPVTIVTSICLLEAFDKEDDGIEDESNPAVELNVTVSGQVIRNSASPTITLNTNSSNLFTAGVIVSAIMIAMMTIIILIIISILYVIQKKLIQKHVCVKPD